MEDPLAEDELPGPYPAHLPLQKRFSVPIQCATPSDNERTKHLNKNKLYRVKKKTYGLFNITDTLPSLLNQYLIYNTKTVPGLSARNLIAAQPPVGTPTVFLSGGSTKLYLAGSLAGSKLPIPVPTTKKLNP